MLWKSNYFFRILSVFLCLGVISGIVLYWYVEAEQIETSVSVEASCGVETTSYSGETGGKTLSLTTTYNTTAQIIIPEGIVDTLTYFKIFGHPKDDILDSRSLPSGKSNVGNQVYNITSYLPNGTAITSFSNSITVILGYNESEISGLDESSLGIYKWNGSQWTVLVDSTVNTSTNTVTATTTQFSYFTISGESSEEEVVCGDGSCSGSETCSSCPTDCGACPSGGGGGGGGGGGAPMPVPEVPGTKVILQGKASPAAYLTVLKDGQVLGTTQANPQADFKYEISNITAGIYTFSVWAEDKNKIKSLAFSFTVNVVSRVTTSVGGIFIPPTISLSKESVRKGETLNIFGYTAPQSKVEVHVNSDEIIEEVIAATSGAWLYSLDTSRLAEGVHSVRAKASTEDGLLCTLGQTLVFGVGVGLPPSEGDCPHADSNKDNKVNLIDFSILLYWWGRSNSCADQNSDGVVNLIDFSIMMYYWTG